MKFKPNLSGVSNIRKVSVITTCTAQNKHSVDGLWKFFYCATLCFWMRIRFDVLDVQRIYFRNYVCLSGMCHMCNALEPEQVDRFQIKFCMWIYFVHISCRFLNFFFLTTQNLRVAAKTNHDFHEIGFKNIDEILLERCSL